MFFAINLGSRKVRLEFAANKAVSHWEYAGCRYLDWQI